MPARGMTAAAIAASASQQQRIVYFVELYFSTIERATTWGRSITWGGNAYMAGGNLLTLPDIEESVEIQSSSASVVLSGVNQANIAIALTENFIDKRMVIMRGFIGTNDQLIIDPVIQFDGRIDGWSLSEDVDNGTSTITWVAASHWVDFERTAGRATNDKEHQVLFPGDKFFEFSGETVDIKWGAV